VDVAFISLRTIAPALLAVTGADTEFVLLVKPQFEAGRARVGKGGVVRDPAVHRAVLREVVDAIAADGLGIERLLLSPRPGADGNREFLAYARRGASPIGGAEIDAMVEDGAAP
jgi:23S rRNA (cytidine1920-2'-O)/16S rRNA (cytidine1409-2'-O)-methyltransferase